MLSPILLQKLSKENALYIPEALIKPKGKPYKKLKVYRERWMMAFILSVLIFTNSKSRIGFGPVAEICASFYKTEVYCFLFYKIEFKIINTGIVN